MYVYNLSHIRLNWIYPLQFPKCQETPCSKQGQYLIDSKPQPLVHKWLKWLWVQGPLLSLEKLLTINKIKSGRQRDRWKEKNRNAQKIEKLKNLQNMKTSMNIIPDMKPTNQVIFSLIKLEFRFIFGALRGTETKISIFLVIKPRFLIKKP